MPPRRRIPVAAGREAVRQWALLSEAGTVDPGMTAMAVRFSLEELAAIAPGRSLEVRVPPFGAVQCIEGSVHRETYLARLKAMEAGGKQTFKLEPDAVADKLVHALEADRPKLRYFVTTPTHVAAGLKRVLPLRLLDRVLARM